MDASPLPVAAVDLDEVETGVLLTGTPDERPRLRNASCLNQPLILGIVAAAGGLAVVCLLVVGTPLRPSSAAKFHDANAPAVISKSETWGHRPSVTMPTTTTPAEVLIKATDQFPDSSPLAAMCNRKPEYPTTAMTRPEDTSDGNLCRDSEEEYGGLCYRNCACLTKVEIATRISAFSCCVTEDCSDVSAWETPSLLPCQGYDVSSANGGTACPHTPGACLQDEEQNYGMCYKRCGLINAEFRYRLDPTTCCKVNPFSSSSNLEMCNLLTGDPSMFVTGEEFSVGGGCGDSNPTDTPCIIHPPLISQTEE